MPKLPQLKKKITSFLTKEDGKISKENLIKAGVLVAAIGLASVKSVSAQDTGSCTTCEYVSCKGPYHCNLLGLSMLENTGEGQHSHCTGDSTCPPPPPPVDTY